MELLTLLAGLASLTLLLLALFVRGHLVDTVVSLLIVLAGLVLGALVGSLVLGPLLLASRLAVGDLAALVVVSTLSRLPVALSLLAVGLPLLTETVVLAVPLLVRLATLVLLVGLTALMLLVSLTALVLLAALVGLTLLVMLALLALVMGVLGVALVGLLCELVVAEHLADPLALSAPVLTGLVLTALALASLALVALARPLVLSGLLTVSGVLLPLLVVLTLLAGLALTVASLLVLLSLVALLAVLALVRLATLVLLAALMGLALLAALALPSSLTEQPLTLVRLVALLLVTLALSTVGPMFSLVLALEGVLVVSLSLTVFLSSTLVVRCVSVHGKVCGGTYPVAGHRARSRRWSRRCGAGAPSRYDGNLRPFDHWVRRHIVTDRLASSPLSSPVRPGRRDDRRRSEPGISRVSRAFTPGTYGATPRGRSHAEQRSLEPCNNSSLPRESRTVGDSDDSARRYTRSD